MRTTLTIDDDVAARLERLRKSRKLSLKALINEALREGLRHLDRRPKPGRAFRTKSVSLGACRIGTIDSVADALAVAEGERFR